MVMLRLLALSGSVILILKTSVAQLEVRPQHVLLLGAGERSGVSCGPSNSSKYCRSLFS